MFKAVVHFIPDPPSSVVVALVDLTEALRPLVSNTGLDEPHTRLLTSEEVEDMYDQATDLGKVKSFFSDTFWRTGMFAKRGVCV